jgi:hypothetical protein
MSRFQRDQGILFAVSAMMPPGVKSFLMLACRGEAIAALARQAPADAVPFARGGEAPEDPGFYVWEGWVRLTAHDIPGDPVYFGEFVTDVVRPALAADFGAFGFPAAPASWPEPPSPSAHREGLRPGGRA